MPQEIVHRTTTNPRDQVFEVTTPLSSRLLFRKPRYLEGSGFLRHLPFLFWLTDMIRPRSFVQIGDLDAVPYFGICQAMDRLDLESRCTGIRLDKAVSEAAERYNDDIYGEFSALRSATVEAATGGMADKSVDLLLVDRVPDEALIAALMRSWPRRLSSRAVVALHGTRGDGYMSGPALEFIENIRATYPTFTLEGSEGLTVVLYGASRNDRLQRLADLKPGQLGFSEARMVFRRLGDTSHFEWESRRADGAEKAAASRAKAAESRLADAEARLKEMTEAFEERASQAAGAQARVYRLETEAEEAERQRAEREARLVELTDETTVLKQTLKAAEQALSEERATKDARIAELEHKPSGNQWEERLTKLTGQMALLTRELEKEQEMRLVQGEDLSEARARATEAEEALAAVQAHADEMERISNELLNSTFWKMTGPARKVVNTLRRH